MLVDREALDLGKRSWRYAMIVRDGVIDRLFVEPGEPGDPCEVSDADTVLAAWAPDLRPPDSVAILARPGCPHCERAKRLRAEHDLGDEEIVLGRDATSRSLCAIAGTTTVPQACLGGRRIGGTEELAAHLACMQTPM